MIMKLYIYTHALYIFLFNFFEGSDDFRRLHSLLDTHSRLVIHPMMGLYVAAPWTTKIPLLNYKWNKFIDIRDGLWSYISEQVEVTLNNFLI